MLEIESFRWSETGPEEQPTAPDAVEEKGDSPLLRKVSCVAQGVKDEDEDFDEDDFDDDFDDDFEGDFDEDEFDLDLDEEERPSPAPAAEEGPAEEEEGTDGFEEAEELDEEDGFEG
jgi:hypothetical protein